MPLGGQYCVLTVRERRAVADHLGTAAKTEPTRRLGNGGRPRQSVPLNYRPGRAVDVPRSVLDITTARETFGWSPRIALREGIAETWDWMKQVG